MRYVGEERDCFCPCAKSRPVANFCWQRKSENILIQTVVWLLVLTLMKIYDEKEQAEQGKKCKMYVVQGEKGHQEVEWS